MKDSQIRAVAFLSLAILLVALGLRIVPAHWTSIWNDREFSGWVAPVANRLSVESRLYEDGLHSPMPPLSFVLLRLLHPHGANWLAESTANFCFQAATILLLFYAFSKQLRFTVAFAAAMAAVPVFLALPKTILYDSMAQFFVALTGVIAAALVQLQHDSSGRRPSYLAEKLLTTSLGLTLALLLLTKQSTGTGTVAGVCLLLFLLPRTQSLFRRVTKVTTVALLTGVLFCLVGLALGPYLSFSGLIHDVFQTGSEPKGGGLRVLRNLLTYVVQLSAITGGMYCLIQIFSFGRMNRFSLPAQCAPCDKDLILPDEGPITSLRFLITMIAASVFGLVATFLYVRTAGATTLLDRAWGTILLNLGLVLILVEVGGMFLQKPAARNADPASHPFVAYAFVFVFSAIFHTLSVRAFHWTSYNNPLILLALAAVINTFTILPGNMTTYSSARKKWLPVTLAAFSVVVMWPLAMDQITATNNCTERWPEIRQLDGAKLRPDAAGMRTVVDVVRSLTSPTNLNEVLLLPNDPNAEAWFERSRPQLSSAIIFTDQYWDRYVDHDFAQLQANPPKVIVIGPRNSWRSFSRKWNVNRGAERLIDMVIERMLPADYSLYQEQAISYQGRIDFMDIYLRRRQ